MMLRYAVFGSDSFIKSTGMFRYFYKKYQRKSIAIQKCAAMIITRPTSTKHVDLIKDVQLENSS